MPLSALLAVLVAALLHASWNLMVKASGDRLVTAAAQVVLAGVVFIPVVIWRGFPGEALWFLVASGVVQVVYLGVLATAYNRADLSFVYPIARGSAPLVIALGSFAGLSEIPGGRGWLALALICGGVVGLGLASRSRHGLGPSLLTGLLIAVYISIDGAGVRVADDLLAYTSALYVLTAALVLPVVLVARSKQSLNAAIAADWPRFLGGGMASMASYGLLLFASRLAPLSLVAAARETAVVFATFGGWWFLDESVGRKRAIAVVVIALGMVVLALTR
jgi:drug/metabolite transporter (DMT)-like permease